ncbi:T9SS type A sorting domain-containing protein [Psychroserpens algicola]|uniref:Proprotein convertase P-domain-containing protein n=1 Tax=Psychroserpens algicola TaxID=1719034 RepID=A0ABT0H9C0_9FLAO|nr:T9SS type A sorting domain-containing protein [Psychroserpens algicola]MCK8480945.1 proprotein convertase P-domain-containing protein [Psychroserpens algicola]
MKKNFTFKSIFAVIMLVCAMSSYSQNRTCGMDEYMEEMLKDPVLAKEYKENQKKFKAELTRRQNGDLSKRGVGTIVIPVAVHFPSGNEADRACLVALAQSQVDVLNADYSATNADISQWASASAFYPGLQPGSANIQFCLAISNHPVDGNTGMIVDPELLEGEPAVTIGYNFANGSGFPEQDSNWIGYMNFVVKNIGGLLGYSPGGGSLANGGAVVMNLGAFGTGSGCFGSGIVPQAPFNLGRTVTHELGHFYSLNHPWGPGGPSCATDDGFTDTPNTGQETYNCPSAGSLTACVPTENILSMNYMDYVNDACMYMFTPQQMVAVDAYVASVIAPAIKPGVCDPVEPTFIIAANDSEVYSCPATDTEAVFNFSYTTIQDFAENTTFSATGEPAGTTVTFNPTSRSDDGDFTMTINNLSGSALGDYVITVTGTSNTVTKSIDVLLSNNCVECNTYTATDTPIAISASGTPTITSTITVVPDAPILDVNVTIDITHTWVNDLDITLTSPNGTVVELTSDNGAAGADDYTNTVFDQEAATPITSGTAPFTGSFIPEGDLSLIYGEMSAGDWVLTVFDDANQDGGSLINFELEICTEQELSVSDFSSDEFSIFPNPNKGEFTILLNSSSTEDINIDVFDIRGRQIFSNSYVNTSEFREVVNLNSVQSGMYLVTVSDGLKKTTRKIIVE